MHHLAQANIGRVLAPLDDPRIQGFVDLLPPLNALADGWPGFVWRLQTASGDATGIKIAPDPLFIINLSVWECREALWDYVYRSGHLEALRRRREWFERHVQAHMVLWWLPAGELPTPEDVMPRVDHLRAHGPTPFAFTFRDAFEADGLPASGGRRMPV